MTGYTDGAGDFEESSRNRDSRSLRAALSYFLLCALN